LIGFNQLALPVFGGTLLNDASVVIPHALNATGNHTLSLPVPSPVARSTIYFQAAYFDTGAVQSISMSAGVAMPIR
jgi:hypothetical protein